MDAAPSESHSLSIGTSCVAQMGYGSRALELLADYYQGRIPNISEDEGESQGLRNTAVRCVLNPKCVTFRNGGENIFNGGCSGSYIYSATKACKHSHYAEIAC